MSSESFSIVVDCAHEIAMLDVQVFESETLFDLVEVIKGIFLKCDSLVVEKSDHHIIVPFVAHGVEAIAAFFVNVQFLA